MSNPTPENPVEFSFEAGRKTIKGYIYSILKDFRDGNDFHRLQVVKYGRGEPVLELRQIIFKDITKDDEVKFSKRIAFNFEDLNRCLKTKDEEGRNLFEQAYKILIQL